MASTLPRINPAHFLKFVSEDYLTSIGRVITQWSMMEAVLDAAIWQAARLRNDLGRSVTAQMQVLGKLDLLGALLMQTQPVLGEQFKIVADYVRDCLSGKRNMVAHGMWASAANLPHALVVKFSAKGRLVSQGGVIPREDLEALALDVASVTSWLIDLCEMLPALKQRPGGLGHKIPDTQNRPDCAIRKQRALQPPTRRPKVPPPQQKRKGKTPPKKRDVRSHTP